MREIYGDLHHGKYSDAVAHYLDVNYNAQDFEEDASLEHIGEWCGIIGRRVLFQDGQGFVTLITYRTKEEAREGFDKITLGWYEEEWEEEEPTRTEDDAQYPEGMTVTADGYRGIVFRVAYVENGETVAAYMVGDDRIFIFNRNDLTAYDDAVCGCGQVGCGWADNGEDN